MNNNGKQPTMKDVARLAGVSLGTVSKVFNGIPVGDEYKSKVEAAAKSLGYQVNDGWLRIWVRDTGKGIPANHCNDHIFERFVKIDEFEQGTGLGLSICRSLALSLGGKVGMESELGNGSLFWVDVPYK